MSTVFITNVWEIWLTMSALPGSCTFTILTDLSISTTMCSFRLSQNPSSFSIVHLQAFVRSAMLLLSFMLCGDIHGLFKLRYTRVFVYWLWNICDVCKKLLLFEKINVSNYCPFSVAFWWTTIFYKVLVEIGGVMLHNYCFL